MEKLGIVIPVMYNFKGAVVLLESVKTNLNWTPFIVPNWENNIGVAAGWNKGVDAAREAGCTHILISNDDIVMSPYCMDAMHDGFAEENDMVTANNMRETETADSIKDNLSAFTETGYGPDFSCFMIRANLFDDVGRFDENFFPAYYEDNDYHRRMELLGFNAVRSVGAKMYHAGSITQNFLGPENAVCPPEKFRANHEYYVKKWGVPSGFDGGFLTPYDDPSLTPKDWRKFPRPN